MRSEWRLFWPPPLLSSAAVVLVVVVIPSQPFHRFQLHHPHRWSPSVGTPQQPPSPAPAPPLQCPRLQCSLQCSPQCTAQCKLLVNKASCFSLLQPVATALRECSTTQHPSATADRSLPNKILTSPPLKAMATCKR